MVALLDSILKHHKFMTEFQKTEKRWIELINKPIKNNEEIDEMSVLSQKIELGLSKEHSVLIEELSTVGININSVYDLVNTKKRYPLAIPFLVKHLLMNYHDKNKEGIVRALCVKEAVGFATPYLIDEYHKTSNDKKNLKWVIGYAIFITATKDYIEDFYKIIDDKSNGISRQYLVMALTKFKIEKLEDYLISLFDQEELIVIVIEALGKIMSKKAISSIEYFTNNKNKNIKKIAIRTLKKLQP
jgi:hypothetical protein